MNNMQEIKTKLVEFNGGHEIASPMGNGVTDGITTCSCGAQWRTWYSRYGLEWRALNEQAEVHDQEAAKLPGGYGVDYEGNLFETR